MTINQTLKPPEPSVWQPQPGPQHEAILATWCEELFFGGARGGGKSDYLLGDFLQDVPTHKENWHGILFRRTTPELEQLVRRSHQLFSLAGAIWKEQKATWVFPQGSTLKMRHLERTQDASKYQGHEYCVAVGTPILMADGSHKAIEEVVVGDEVQTLEGPKPVTATVAPYEAPCVKIENHLGSQVNPVWHPVLTDEGWQSFSSLAGIDSKEFERRVQEGQQLPSLNANVRCLVRSQGLDRRSNDSSTRYRVPCKSRKRFDGSNQESHRLSCVKFLDQRLAELLGLQNLCRASLSLAFGGASYVRPDSRTLRDSLDGYRSSYRSYDEQLLVHSETFLERIRQLVGAASPFPSSRKPGEAGGTQGYIRPCGDTYEHFYTGRVRRVIEDSSYVPCSIQPIGLYQVADITVADANHYINANNLLVNCNTWVGFDELPQWANPEAYKMLKATLRSAALVPEKRVRATGNPGGPGHQWVKDYFIDPAPLGSIPIDDKAGTRMFICSKVEDNKILLKNDPDYIRRLEGVGSPELVRAWLEGDWSAVTGAYFAEFNSVRHVLTPRRLPREWNRFRAMDWGSFRPFSVGWFAVASDDYEIEADRWIPKNSIIQYREWYGADGPNKGLKLSPDEIARGIIEMEGDDKISYSAFDPSMWKRDGGPSIAETMAKRGVYGRRADNSRIPGWEQIRVRLRGIEGVPLLYFFSTCKNSIRTIPALQHDLTRVEDVDTDGEDHAADMVRYGVMSRPWGSKAKPSGPLHGVEKVTLDQLWKFSRNRKKKEERY